MLATDMTESLSVIAGVISIAAAAVQLSKTLFEQMNDIKGGPEEIKVISRDAHAFYSTNFLLNVTLREENIRAVVSGDADMAEMLRGQLERFFLCQVEPKLVINWRREAF